MRHLVVITTLFIAFTGTIAVHTALACPDCETALLARERFASDQFLERLMISIMPFVVTLGVAWGAERALDRRRNA